MRLYRTYYPEVLNLSLPHTLELPAESFQHLCKVLRLTDGEEIHLVDNSGGHYIGMLTQVGKKTAFVALTDYVNATNESPLHLHLIQAISRGDRMDLTIQKAVELGVSEITPIFSERCGVSLSGERLEKKMQHWHGIIVAACLQSYRDTIPKLNPALTLEQYLAKVAAQEDQPKLVALGAKSLSTNYEQLYINLNPFAGTRLKEIPSNQYSRINLLIGPEGGLSEQEIAKATAVGFSDYNLGPRVLRTETTGLAALSILQAHLGDL